MDIVYALKQCRILFVQLYHKNGKIYRKYYRYSGFVDFYKYFCRFSSILTDKDTVSQIDYQELEYVCSFLVCVK